MDVQLTIKPAQCMKRISGHLEGLSEGEVILTMRSRSSFRTISETRRIQGKLLIAGLNTGGRCGPRLPSTWGKLKVSLFCGEETSIALISFWPALLSLLQNQDQRDKANLALLHHNGS